MLHSISNVTPQNVTQEKTMNLDEMILSDELRLRGMSKTKLAELLDVSRQTIQRMGENISQEAWDVISGYTPKQIKRIKNPSEYTDDEIYALILRRGGLEGETGREKETDYEICQSVGIKVWEFNKMIADWVKRHPYRQNKNF